MVEYKVMDEIWSHNENIEIAIWNLKREYSWINSMRNYYVNSINKIIMNSN